MNLPFSCGFRILALGLVMSAFISATPAARAQEKPHNLFTNPNFENGLDGWTVKNGTTAVIDPAEKRGNFPSLRIDNAAGADSFVTQKVPVTPNSRYRITAYIKTQHVLSVQRGGKSGACIAVLGGFKSTPAFYGNKSWAKVAFDFVAGQETEIDIGPRLGMYSGLVTGTAWYSELTMVDLGRNALR